jgi:ferritin
MKLTEYVENEEDPLIQAIRTHQHQTNSTLLQTVKNIKKYFQSATKQIKNIIALNMKEKLEEK